MNTISTIIGLIFTVVGVILTIKYKSSFKLTYIANNWFPVLNTFANKLADIEVKYKGKTISQNIYLFSMSIINSGNKDIDKSIIHKPLSIELPLYYKFISSKIISNSDNLEVNTNCKDNKLEMNWSLFKTGEYYRLYSLVEYLGDSGKIPDNNFPKFKFDHRITNLKRIKKYEISFKQNRVITFIFIAVLSLWGLYFIDTGIKNFNAKTSSIQYLYKDGGIVTQTILKLNEDNSVSLYKNDIEIKKLKGNQLEKSELTPVVIEEKVKFIDNVIKAFRIFLGAVLLGIGGYTFARYFAEKKLIENKDL